MRKSRRACIDTENNDYVRCDEAPKEALVGEPMKCIVYDEWVMGPVRYAIREITRFCKEGSIEQAIRIASQLGRSNHIISPDLISELDPLMSKMVTTCSRPDLKWDISPLEPLIEKLWHVVTREMNPAYHVSVDPWMYRWYEHQGRYKEARQIQRKLIAFHREQGNRQREATTINNMAYEYSSEGRWKKAIALYEEAAEIHRVVGPREYYANARANYWTCRFDRGDMRAANIAQLKKELEEIIEILGGSYFERQPLILQARIEEWRGDLTEAIRFAEKAVHAGPKGTRYPEKDRAYVETLRRKSKQI